ncbi:MAG: (Fe-S)-binding protein [Chitinivibrionales bacterium]|nr:(Fe-S)-binding protein [Chitinivibrionales bacterium]
MEHAALNLDKELYTEIHKCIRCGQCNYGTQEAEFSVLCPLYKKGGFFSYSAGGIMQIARLLYEEKTEYTQALQDIVNHCTTCGLCEKNCGVINHHLEVISMLKEQMRKRNMTIASVEQALNAIIERKNPYDQDNNQRFSWLKKDRKTKTAPQFFYFAGCVASFDQKEISSSFSTILDAADIHFTYDPDEWCCGSPLFFSGFIQKGIEAVKHTVDIIQASGQKTVVTACPTCSLMFNKYYPLWSGDSLPFTVLHATQYLDELIMQGRLKPNASPAPKTVYYHDSCHLGRGCALYEQPRRILSSIGNLQVLEFEFSKENSYCCGGGGMTPVGDPKYSNDCATERINQMTHTADALVTACPNCKKTLKLAMRKARKNMPVLDLFELVASTLTEP